MKGTLENYICSVNQKKQMIEARALSFSYGKNRIFSSFNIKLDANFTGIVGVNGAGKSTFLKLVLGLIFPDTGDIFVNGVRVGENRLESIRQIGVLHENAVYPSWANVHEYITWVGVLRGLTREESRSQTDFLVQKFGLQSKKYDKVKNLSAGQRKRFGICQAVIGLPSILFLDEPTANLDVQSRLDVLEFLKEISDTYGIQVILMSHILDDLERYCDKVHIIHKGEIVWEDTTTNLFQTEINKEYVIRGEIPDIPSNVEILRKNKREIVIRISDAQMVKEMKKQLRDGTMIPYRSLLEEKFIELTGGESK